MRFIICFILQIAFLATAFAENSVLIAILARNKAHVLPRFLKCIENQDYPKDQITIYINTNNNRDNTQQILQEWVDLHKASYKEIIFESHDAEGVTLSTNPHDWNPSKFKVLALIRNRSLQKAKETKSAYYFVVDCDNFIAPYTLSDLIKKDKPIIAPLLRAIPEYNDIYANFFADVTASGYYQPCPRYEQIVRRSLVGTFKVPVVHCTYLIQSKYINHLGYIDGTDDYEFVIFSKMARKNQVDQFICNEKEYGTLIHFRENISLEEEKKRMEAILTLP